MAKELTTVKAVYEAILEEGKRDEMVFDGFDDEPETVYILSADFMARLAKAAGR